MSDLRGRFLAVLAVFGLILIAPNVAEPAEGKDGTVHLFNGKDLTNFYTYLGAPTKGERPYGKDHDPEKVFTVHDGMIHVSGRVFGGLITEKEYENYHLLVE